MAIKEISWNGKKIVLSDARGLQGHEVVENQKKALAKLKSSGIRLIITDMREVATTTEVDSGMREVGKEIVSIVDKAAVGDLVRRLDMHHGEVVVCQRIQGTVYLSGVIVVLSVRDARYLEHIHTRHFSQSLQQIHSRRLLAQKLQHCGASRGPGSRHHWDDFDLRLLLADRQLTLNGL